MDFILSADTALDDTDVVVNSPFGSSQQAHMQDEASAEENHDMSPTMENEKLVFTDGDGGRFCDSQVVYLFVRATVVNAELYTDPDNRNGIVMKLINIDCTGGR